MRALLFAFLALLPAAASAQQWAAGPASAEARYTGGADGYWGAGFHGAASMSVDAYTRPYAAFDFQTDQLYKNDFTAKLGAEQDVGPFWTAHAALGVIEAQLRDAGNTGGGYLLEMGADHRAVFWRFGGVYQVSFSQAEPVGSPRSVERHSLLEAEQQAAASGTGISAPNKFWFHEVSAYASGPLPGPLRLVSLGFAVAGWARMDDNSTGVAERADLSLRLSPDWSVSAGVSFEQPFGTGEKSGFYETAALKYSVPTVGQRFFDIRD